MNCLEFRRAKLADPRRLSAAADEHLQACPQCSEFAEGIERTELLLQEKLAVSVPDGLAERVLLRYRSAARPRWTVWALAASLVLAAAIGFVQWSEPPERYARLAIDHVLNEPESLNTVHDAELPTLVAALESFGGSLIEPLEGMRYIKLCPLEQGVGWHIVFETPQGLATLLLVRDNPVRSAASLSEHRLNALVRPAGQGYYALVTPSAQSTALAEDLLRRHIRWRA